jgi:hypothetical protein
MRTSFTRGVTFGSGVFKRIAANYTVLPDDFGGILYCTAADIVVTLPLAANHTGKTITVVTGSLSTGTGTSISPNSADNIYGNALSAVDDKDLINTGSTDVVGDSATVISDGTNWLITNVTGTWAKET